MSSTRALEVEGRYILVAAMAEGRRVLDIGCGDASGLVQIALAGAEEIVGTSGSSTAAQQTLSDAGVGGVDLRPDFSPPLSFTDGAFDLVVCNDLADRLKQNPSWLKEIRRVLAPEGHLVVAVAVEDGEFLSEVAGQRGQTALSYQE